MIRLFNHYIPRAALGALGFDLGLVLVLVMLAVAINVGGLAQALPVAGTHVVSVAACLAVVGGASGLYESGSRGSAARSAARAALVLLVLLPVAYVIFGLLPAEHGHRGALRASARRRGIPHRGAVRRRTRALRRARD
jgi:hypothetical protein